MSVLRMDPPDEYAVPIRRKKADVPVSPQTQSWARGNGRRSIKRNDVIPEKRLPLPAVSAEGIRWDVLIISLSLIALLFLGVLCADIGALFSGGDRIGKLTAGIASLENSNSILREELSWARADLSAGLKESEPARIVILSPTP